MPESRFKPNVEFDRQVRSQTFSLYQRDYEMIEVLAQYLGTSKSEAIRTAVRALAAQLGVMKK